MPLKTESPIVNIVFSQDGEHVSTWESDIKDLEPLCSLVTR